MTVLGAAPGHQARERGSPPPHPAHAAATYLVMLLVLAITLVPMLYLILSGFRTTGQLGSNPNGLPHPWVWSNYATILTSGMFWQAVQNSAVIAVAATALAVVLGSMAAFALSRYAFRGRDGLFLLFTAGLLFPLNTAALPLFLLLQKIGMNDNLFGGGAARSGVLAAGHHRHPAPVHAGDPWGTRGRGDRRRRHQDSVLGAVPAPATCCRSSCSAPRRTSRCRSR